jgi:hypothetical protein
MKELSRNFYPKKKHKVTCCRVLSGKLPPESPERQEKCAGIVGDVAEILERIVGRS